MNLENFVNPGLLWLLAALVPMAAYYVYRTCQGKASITISSVRGVEGVPRSSRYYLRHLPFILRCTAFAFLVVALARPQSSHTGSSSSTEGIDIVLSLDISSSMLTRDFNPDRITVAKEMSANFINDRPTDRIGLVVFAGESFTQCPLTTDKATLLSLLGQVGVWMVEDGTAIGHGLATAVNRLRESPAQSKVIILLTDGVNNSGQITPLVAADLAASYGIKVYTVGVGSQGMAPSPVYNRFGEIVFEPVKVEIDEEVLRGIAEKTGGRYFRATDNKHLEMVYDEINTLERTKIEVEDVTSYEELFVRYVLWALGILALEFFIRRIYLRQIP